MNPRRLSQLTQDQFVELALNEFDFWFSRQTHVIDVKNKRLATWNDFTDYITRHEDIKIIKYIEDRFENPATHIKLEIRPELVLQKPGKSNIEHVSRAIILVTNTLQIINPKLDEYQSGIYIPYKRREFA